MSSKKLSLLRFGAAGALPAPLVESEGGIPSEEEERMLF